MLLISVLPGVRNLWHKTHMCTERSSSYIMTPQRRHGNALSRRKSDSWPPLGASLPRKASLDHSSSRTSHSRVCTSLYGHLSSAPTPQISERLYTINRPIVCRPKDAAWRHRPFLRTCRPSWCVCSSLFTARTYSTQLFVIAHNRECVCRAVAVARKLIL